MRRRHRHRRSQNKRCSSDSQRPQQADSSERGASEDRCFCEETNCAISGGTSTSSSSSSTSDSEKHHCTMARGRRSSISSSSGSGSNRNTTNFDYEPIFNGSSRQQHRQQCENVAQYARQRIASTRKRLLIALLVLAVLCVTLGLGLYYGLREQPPGIDVPDDGKPRSFGQGAVTANGFECAAIGRDILRANGTAVDAAIATLFCEGVSCPQSMGLGGGVIFTIYMRATRTTETLMAREWAPLAAHRDMYLNHTGEITGAISVAVPGELLGYWEAHQKYGRLPWAQLIEPTIRLCRQGHLVTGYLAGVLDTRKPEIVASPTLRAVFFDPATNDSWLEGQRIKREKLADTLEIVAREGADTLYKRGGTILKELMADLREFGSIVTEDDFTGYKVRWERPIESRVMHDRTMHTSRLPTTGVLVSYIMNILADFLPERGVLAYHRILEAFKFAYGKRTGLGDEPFVPGVGELLHSLTDEEYARETRRQINDTRTSNDYRSYGANYSLVEDHGTAHINVLAPNGDAVAVTSTINNVFGSKLHSPRTGIILNDEMDDFATPGSVNSYGVPASPANYIAPGKRPLSSMCPIVITDGRGDVRMLIGGAGGIKITSSVAFAIIHHWYFNQTLQDSVDDRRLHHQLMPMQIDYEKDFDQATLDALIQLGHKTYQASTVRGFTSLTAISVDEEGAISMAVDPRRIGSSKELV